MHKKTRYWSWCLPLHHATPSGLKVLKYYFKNTTLSTVITDPHLFYCHLAVTPENITSQYKNKDVSVVR